MPGSNWKFSIMHGYDNKKNTLLRRAPIATGGDHRLTWWDNAPIAPEYKPPSTKPKQHGPLNILRIVRIVSDARTASASAFIPPEAINIELEGQVLMHVWGLHRTEFLDITYHNNTVRGDPVDGYQRYESVGGTFDPPSNVDPDFGFPGRAIIQVWTFDAASINGTAAAIAKLNQPRGPGIFTVEAGPVFSRPLMRVRFRFTMPDGSTRTTGFIDMEAGFTSSGPTEMELRALILNIAQSQTVVNPNPPPSNVDEWQEFADDVKAILEPQGYIVLYKNRPNEFDKIGYWMFRHTVPGMQYGGGPDISAPLEKIGHLCSTVETYNLQILCDDTADYDMSKVSSELQTWMTTIDKLDQYIPIFSGIYNPDNVHYFGLVIFDKGFAIDWDNYETSIHNKVHLLRLFGTQAPSMWGYCGGFLKYKAFVDDQFDYKTIKSIGLAANIANRIIGQFSAFHGGGPP